MTLFAHMSRHFTIALGLSIALTACSPYQTVEQIFPDQNEKIVYQMDKKTGQKHGPFQRFLAGILVEKALYHNDTLNGVRFIFDNQGNKEVEEHYEMGVFNGPYRTFYTSGKIRNEGLYVNGVMTGEWKKYYESSQLMETVTMVDNNENGPFLEYYENGNLKAKGNYLEGDYEHGELFMYDEQGQLQKKMECNRGFCKTTWEREPTN